MSGARLGRARAEPAPRAPRAPERPSSGQSRSGAPGVVRAADRRKLRSVVSSVVFRPASCAGTLTGPAASARPVVSTFWRSTGCEPRPGAAVTIAPCSIRSAFARSACAPRSSRSSLRTGACARAGRPHTATLDRQAAASAQAPPAAARVDATRLMKDLATLAAANMEGRLTGTPGNKRAQAYILEQFKQLKLAAGEQELRAEVLVPQLAGVSRRHQPVRHGPWNRRARPISGRERTLRPPRGEGRRHVSRCG